MTPLLPSHALQFFGAAHLGDWGGVPWGRGLAHSENFLGMWGKSVVDFGTSRGVLFSSDADIDVDGPGGSLAVDPCWQPDTSLRDAGGHSINSREFPGVVTPPGLREFGVRLGDYCLVCWGGKICAAQVYDIGPTRKIGEDSVYLGRRIGLVKPDQSDRHAATAGNDATDVTTLIFPGSGPGHAMPLTVLVQRADFLWRQFTGRAAA